MNIKLTLGERLKDLRVERHLKLETLAEQTGLSKSALSKYESDDVTDLSIYAVTTLAEFYNRICLPCSPLHRVLGFRSLHET